ncbi:deaminase [Prauserella marina]|uniref:Dihydrofolate reductase n=1 Tax=Prauserella marina TaxID=530584 RepID=A0A222VWG4_9PSEU|nr:dihydrofolate reductase family protein [Prauserella marina]ASR38279.1 deaminase [Prauserella marina]PWV78519.1 dihydrofolate reductase [Prauserella marina]SDC87799.1 Dihydrofolate reductase [Prauserella marina]
MGQLVVVNFVSLDGVIQAPLSSDEDRDGGFSHGGWVTPYSDATVAEYMRTTTTNAEGLLLGRRSYDILTEAWSGADESEKAVEAMNRMPKYVVTRSHRALAWNNSFRLDDDLPSAVNGLKRRLDGELVSFGSGTLIRALAEHDLIDEYRLLLFPVTLGSGKRMFGEAGQPSRFTLTGTTTTPSGVVILSYANSA